MRLDSHEKLFGFLRERGVAKVLVKELSENDNSKQQIYLGGSFEALQVLPFGSIESDTSPTQQNYKAPVNLVWIGEDGVLSPAPSAQLILYPSYPEVRLSGFLRGSPNAPSELMRPIEATHRHGGSDGRLLILGIAPQETILALVAPPSSKLATSLLKGPLTGAEKAGVFYVLNIVVDDEDNRLFEALRQIIALGWQPGQKLTSTGVVVPYRNQNAGGYTLEALLGILPNGLPGPDMLGWEVKGHGGDRITLMTPEPDGGIYVHDGLRAFLERYGRKSDKDTLYFTGSHRYRVRSNLTGLTIRIAGYAPERGKIESPNGAIQLVDGNDTVTASWSFARLIELWAKKHNKAVFISFSKRQAPNGSPEFRFDPTIQTGRGTDFLLFLRSFARLSVFYDPGCRIRGFESPKPEQKKRNQFRISVSALSDLYHSFGNLEL